MDDLTPDEVALIVQHQRERAAAAAAATKAATRHVHASEDESRPPSENSENNGEKDDENNNENNDADEDDPLGEEENTSEENIAHKIIPEGSFKLPLPPTDIGYNSKEHLCEEVQKFAIQHGYTLIKKRSNKRRERISLRCDHGLIYKPHMKDKQRKRDNHQIRAQSYPFFIKSSHLDGLLYVRIISPYHNHGPLPAVILPTTRKHALQQANIKDYIKI